MPRTMTMLPRRQAEGNGRAEPVAEPFGETFHGGYDIGFSSLHNAVSVGANRGPVACAFIRVSARMPLDAQTLARSVVSPGTATAWKPVFDRLDAGENIVVGVFGASVAQVCCECRIA